MNPFMIAHDSRIRSGSKSKMRENKQLYNLFYSWCHSYRLRPFSVSYPYHKTINSKSED